MPDTDGTNGGLLTRRLKGNDMKDEWDKLKEAFDKYTEAKNELCRFYGSTDLKFDGEFYTYSCADCGADLYLHHKSVPSYTQIPLLHCGKVRLGNMF